MKIIPNRTMRLGGKRVEQGKPADVPDADGELAVRHGWAIKAPSQPKGKAAPEHESVGGE
jgi:hypothetical protein